MRLKTGHNQHGFSLVELLVVFAIVATISAVAVGSYSSFRKGRRIQSGAAMVNSLFVTARSYAISTNQHYRVVLQMRNPQTRTEQYALWIDQVSAPSEASPNPSTLDEAVRAKVTTPELLPEGLRISDTLVTVVESGQTPTTTTVQFPKDNYAVVHFSPDGTSDGAVVHLIDAASDPAVAENYYTVKLYQPTAATKILAEAKK